MKKFLSLFAIATLFIAGLSSCDEEDAKYTPAVSNIQIKTADVLFDPQASTGKIVYDCNAKVSFSTEADWISLSQTESNAINVEVTANTALIGRTGVVVLSDGNGKVNVIVQQRGLAFGFYDNTFKDIKPAGATYSIEGQASFEVTFKDCPDWIHFNKTATGYDIVVDATTTSNDRSAIVTLDGNGMTAKMEFSQKGSFNFVSANYDIPTSGDSTILVKGVITSDITVEIKDAGDWFAIDTLENGYKLLIAANPNPESRTATLKLSCTDYSATYIIKQVGIYMNVLVNGAAARALILGDEAIDNEYEIESNAEFTISSDSEWLTASLKEGKLNVVAEENTTGHFRTGYIYYSAGNFTDSVRVNQFDFDKDINGMESYFVFYDDEDEMDYLVAEYNKESIYFPQVDLSLPCSFDPETMSYSFESGADLGVFSVYDMKLLMITTEGKLSTAKVPFNINLEIYSDDPEELEEGEEPEDYMIGEIACDPSIPYAGFAFGAFQEGSFVGTLVICFDAWFESYIAEEEEEEPANAAPRRNHAKAKTANVPLNFNVNKIRF